MTWLTATEYLCRRWALMCLFSLGHKPRPILGHDMSLNVTYHQIVHLTTTTRFTTSEELLTLPKHLGLTHGFCWIRVAQSLVFSAVFCGQIFLCVFFSSFPFGHCIVCSSIYIFWIPLWYFQIFPLIVTTLFLQILPCKRRSSRNIQPIERSSNIQLNS
jgi:hypothetical protein